MAWVLGIQGGAVITLKLLRRTGDSRRAPGLNPAGMVRQGSREIGSRAGDMALYLAPAPAPASAATRRSARTGFSGEPPEPAGRSPELGFGESAIGAGVRRGLSEEDERDRQGREERERRGGFGGDSGKGSLGKVAPSRSGGRVGVGGHDTC